MSNISMVNFFRLKRTVVATDKPVAGGEAQPRLFRMAASDPPPPVHIDIERMDRALEGKRTVIPNGLSVQEICQFIDHVAKDVR